MVKQNKGKDLHKVPKSKLSQGPYLASKKFDGHYTQIIFDGTNVTFLTSGNKEFYLSDMADFIKNNYTQPFHIECEYNYHCEGKLGDRGKSAIITTYRTKFSKGINTTGNTSKDIFRVLDILSEPTRSFVARQEIARQLFRQMPWFYVPMQLMVSLDDGKELAQQWVKEGFEGAMLKHRDHLYQPGKRTNDIIKIKPRLTADLLCVGTKEGIGKYEGMIGALLLRDKAGREVWAGSGLSDADRNHMECYYIGTVYEIEYERIDETYIQPIIKYRRKDKSVEDID